MPGIFVIISSPSGGGKNSVINALVERLPRATRLVTTTSRTPRPGDVDGVDYHFISKSEFENKIQAGEFLEYNLYADNYYGTQKGDLNSLLDTYEVVFSQIEVNGKHALDQAGVQNLSIFLLPESLDVLRERIQKRGGVGEIEMEKRLTIAAEEIGASTDYDFRVINREGKLESTVDEIERIIGQNSAKLSS